MDIIFSPIPEEQRKCAHTLVSELQQSLHIGYLTRTEHDQVLLAMNTQFLEKEGILVVEDELLLSRKDMEEAFKAMEA